MIHPCGRLRGLIHSCTVPVIAIFTKFDDYVEDVVQQLQEEAEDEGRSATMSEIDALAARKAEESFGINYRAQLEKLPHPPEAIVCLSRRTFNVCRIVFAYLTCTYVFRTSRGLVGNIRR